MGDKKMSLFSRISCMLFPQVGLGDETKEAFTTLGRYMISHGDLYAALDELLFYGVTPETVLKAKEARKTALYLMFEGRESSIKLIEGSWESRENDK